MNITCAENEPFKSFCTDKEEEYVKRHPNDSNALSNLFTMTDESGDDYGDIRIRLPIIGKVTIPKTKLLNMFLHRKEQEKSYRGIVSDKPLKTRLMYFDLILIK